MAVHIKAAIGRGDYIYYHAHSGDTYPGRIVSVGKKRVRIRYNGMNGDVYASVLPSNLELQRPVNPSAPLTAAEIANVEQVIAKQEQTP